MPTVVLIRHGRTAANASGVLAGRDDVALDDTGLTQVEALTKRLGDVQPAAVVSSPLERCVHTARNLLDDAGHVQVDDRLNECDYGDWSGQPLSDLRKRSLWKVVQDHPSGAVFPGGEAMRDVQQRAVQAIRDHDARISRSAGRSAVWFAVSHGDVIKSVVADALGMHLDHFQRILIDPCSLTVISYTDRRPFVGRVNDIGGDTTFLRQTGRRGRRSTDSDAVVGGGRGGAAR